MASRRTDLCHSRRVHHHRSRAGARGQGPRRISPDLINRGGGHAVPVGRVLAIRTEALHRSIFVMQAESQMEIPLWQRFALAALIFLTIATIGFVQPFVPLYMEASGLTRNQIGWVMGLA